MVVLPLPFCCLDKVGQILWVIHEGSSWLLELMNGQCVEQAIILQKVRNVLGDGFDIKIEGGHRLGSPRVIKDIVFEALHGHHK